MSAASDAASVQNMLTTDASSRSLEEFAFPDVELDPVAVLMDELKHEDIGLRVNAVKHLAAIAAALGIERTRSELIPFLSDTSEEADEVLAVVAEELGCFAEAVGGAAHAHILLPILGRFAGEEDMQTREKAIESLLAVSALISRETAQTALFPIIEALATHEWFPRKQSAAVLIPKTFSMFSREKQTRLVTLFVALVHDDMPMVRRVAAVNFPMLLEVIPQPSATEIASLFECVTFFVAETLDSVRFLAVGCLLAFGERQLAIEGRLGDALQDLFFRLLHEEAWRIKFALAKNFPRLFALFETAAAQRDVDLLAIFATLLQDPEAEVRCAACDSLVPFIEAAIGRGSEARSAVCTTLAPLFRTLAADVSEAVRVAFSAQIGAVCVLVGGDAAATQALLDVFCVLLREERCPAVRLNAVTSIDKLQATVGIATVVEALLPALGHLAADAQWRVRQTVVDTILPFLGAHFGVVFFNERLCTFLTGAFGDHAFSVRRSAVECAASLIAAFGGEWACNVLVPELQRLAREPNYLLRCTALMAISRVAALFDAAFCASTLLPMAVSFSEDSVANIRINVSKCLLAIAACFADKSHIASDSFGARIAMPSSAKDTMQKTLYKLQSDADCDVRYFAERAIESLAL